MSQLGPSTTPSRVSPTVGRFSLVITNLIKLGGLLIALNEALIRSDIRPGAIAVAALMMAGAQSLETFFRAFFGGGVSG